MTTTPNSPATPIPPAAIVAVVVGTLLGAAWLRSRRHEAALRERTAARLRVPAEGN
ncbi:hypothetical protein LK533_08705 [Sphingomonas sp. PL-96]|uniref:hypothetical protein n=1 Tax=Sphingomonas sp. PL-96 TaxID=2887201 RepID=UPI001E41CCA9|nr:hypothetical protein [Sphingomonas sp. PL-96]MCC2976750.1 hypothetical protein [Sphingomonas sp. PL-96]